MPRTSAQNKEIKEKRRQQLLQAGTRFFAAGTYKSFRIDAVAKYVHVSHGLFFHYFEDKGDLFSSVWQEEILSFPGLPDYKKCLEIGGTEGLKELCNELGKYRRLDAKGKQKAKIYVLYPLDDVVLEAFPKLIKPHSLRTVLGKLLTKGQEEGNVIAGPVHEITNAATLLFANWINDPESNHPDLIFNLLTKGIY